MAEGGKVSVDDGKSTDGKKQNSLITISDLQKSHDQYFQFGAWLTKHIVWQLFSSMMINKSKTTREIFVKGLFFWGYGFTMNVMFCFPAADERQVRSGDLKLNFVNDIQAGE